MACACKNKPITQVTKNTVKKGISPRSNQVTKTTNKRIIIRRTK